MNIARGLQFLHDRNIVHLDLKSPNGAPCGTTRLQQVWCAP